LIQGLLDALHRKLRIPGAGIDIYGFVLRLANSMDRRSEHDYKVGEQKQSNDGKQNIPNPILIHEALLGMIFLGDSA
jgi:hypothetical protein